MFAFYEYGYYSVYFGGAINFYLNDTCLVKGKFILSAEPAFCQLGDGCSTRHTFVSQRGIVAEKLGLQ